MRLFRFEELRKLVILAWAALVFAGLANAQPNDADREKSATPPGLFITPTALDHAVQQILNPGLTNYPNFVAGEAVKAVVSPDGKTLAILTAGMNSLYDASGNTQPLPRNFFFCTTSAATIRKSLPSSKSSSSSIRT